MEVANRNNPLATLELPVNVGSWLSCPEALLFLRRGQPHYQGLHRTVALLQVALEILNVSRLERMQFSFPYNSAEQSLTLSPKETFIKELGGEPQRHNYIKTDSSSIIIIIIKKLVFI